MATKEDERRLTSAVTRLRETHGHLVLELDFGDAIAVLANVQLALRHPLNVGEAGRTAREFAEQVIARLEEAEPEIGRLLRMGFDPTHDVGSVDEVLPEAES